MLIFWIDSNYKGFSIKDCLKQYKLVLTSVFKAKTPLLNQNSLLLKVWLVNYLSIGVNYELKPINSGLYLILSSELEFNSFCVFNYKFTFNNLLEFTENLFDVVSSLLYYLLYELSMISSNYLRILDLFSGVSVGFFIMASKIY